MTWEILGTDCPACDLFLRVATQFAEQHNAAQPNRRIEVKKSGNFLQIAAFQLTATPGFVVNGELLDQGRAWSPRELAELVAQRS